MAERYTCICAGPKRQSCIVGVEAEDAPAAARAGADVASELGGAWWVVAVLAVGSVDMLAAAGVAGHHGYVTRRTKP